MSQSERDRRMALQREFESMRKKISEERERIDGQLEAAKAELRAVGQSASEQAKAQARRKYENRLAELGSSFRQTQVEYTQNVVAFNKKI